MGILMEMVLFVGGFLAAFAGYLLHTMLHYALRHGRLNPLSRRMEGVATAIIFCGYAGWGLMIATDPVYLGLPVPIAVFGGIAGVAGVVLLLLAIRGLHGFRGEHQLLRFHYRTWQSGYPT